MEKVGPSQIIALRPVCYHIDCRLQLILLEWREFWQQVPVQTSPKMKICSQFFIAFLKSTVNFEYLEKKISLKA